MEIGMLAIGLAVFTGIGAGIGIGIATGKASPFKDGRTIIQDCIHSHKRSEDGYTYTNNNGFHNTRRQKQGPL